MRAFDPSLLDRTAIREALRAEAEYSRTWLAPEPWWPALTSRAEEVADHIHRKFVRGHIWPRSQVVDIRKPGHNTRPVAVMSPEVRILYRALVSEVVPVDARVDRSAAKYADFVVAPIREAYTSGGGLRRLGDAIYSHILSADIASFYQYIDHTILRDELDSLGAGLSQVDALLELLHDIEGRGFGIPQRSEPSDWLSEFYAARVGRWVARDGFDMWRYSDDFRVGCRSYPEVLDALESLSRSARDVGLVLNDQKTVARLFLSYFVHNVDTEVDDASATIDPTDVEAAVSSDYPHDDEDQAVEDAVRVVGKLWDPDSPPQPEDSWNLRQLSPEQHRSVRRALNTLTRNANGVALDLLLAILRFQPAMTHKVVSYAESVAGSEADRVAAFFDRAIETVSLNEWQRAWIAFGLGVCRVTIDGSRHDWLRAQLVERPDSLAAAQASVTLARAGADIFHEVDQNLRVASADYVPWYLVAVRDLRSRGNADDSRANALAADVISTVILESVSE